MEHSQISYSEINVLTEKTTEIGIAYKHFEMTNSRQDLIIGITGNTPEANRSSTGSEPEMNDIRYRQQETDTYWMDIIEVVGFSIIGNIFHSEMLMQENFGQRTLILRNVWCNRKLCNVRYIGIK